MKYILLFLMSSLFLTAGCTLDRREYDELKATQDEYRAQLLELRQANETINRNIRAAYQELEALKAQLAAVPVRPPRSN
jgi:chromosome segregation ATPase